MGAGVRVSKIVIFLWLAAVAPGLPRATGSTGTAELKAKAEAGDAKAQVALGRAYENGDGVPQNDNLAAVWYRKAAEQGDAEAQNAVGILYRLGRGGPKDHDEAVRWYRRAAKQGNANAMFNVGAAYYNAEGAPYDKIVAFVWFSLAGDVDPAIAEAALKPLLPELRPGWIVEGQLKVGDMYEKGDEVPQNMAAAAKWYRKGADAGHPYGMLKLYHMYAAGQGVARDDIQAAEWFQKAFKSGYGPALFEHANRLYTGSGGLQPNLREASKWYRKAACAGFFPAMFNLGLMYARGEGVKQDNVTAYAWLWMAHANGVKEAKTAVDMLAAKLSPKEIKRAQGKMHGISRC
ncbi:MAG TPA: SEL1-like repeat protein [Terriglobales bacterium]|nr:SEL1-like repeat protein [Terriglobales bacterium]